MATVASDLDKIQDRLHDSGTLWSRAELLRYYNDGYRDLFIHTKAFARITCMDVPGRFTYTHSYEWEDRHISGLTWMFALPGYNITLKCTNSWEIESIEGVTPQTALDGITQSWERCYSNETDRHFNFGLTKEHNRIKRIAWDDKLLVPISLREMDQNDNAWMKRVGEPVWWSPGTGRSRSFELYEIRTDYQQGYELQEYYNGGGPRYFTGSRTYSVSVDKDASVNSWAYTTSGDSDALIRYAPPLISGMGARITTQATDTATSFCIQAWEVEMLNGVTVGTGDNIGCYTWENQYGAADMLLGTGTIRSILSPDRQYIPTMSGMGAYPMLGIIRNFGSSVKGLFIYETVIPDSDLDETDQPYFIPAQIQKYLRFFVLARAFAKVGEGNRPDMSAHYKARYDLGVLFFRRLADVTSMDKITKRQATEELTGRPGRVRLPSHFERQLF